MRTMAAMTRKYFTTEQVAEQLAAPDAASIRRMIREGRLHAINIGTKRRPMYRISEAELIRYEEANAA